MVNGPMESPQRGPIGHMPCSLQSPRSLCRSLRKSPARIPTYTAISVTLDIALCISTLPLDCGFYCRIRHYLLPLYACARYRSKIFHPANLCVHSCPAPADLPQGQKRGKLFRVTICPTLVTICPNLYFSSSISFHCHSTFGIKMGIPAMNLIPPTFHRIYLFCWFSMSCHILKYYVRERD